MGALIMQASVSRGLEKSLYCWASLPGKDDEVLPGGRGRMSLGLCPFFHQRKTRQI